MKTNLFDLTGKRAMITGGTHGLGMAMANALAEAGASLVITGFQEDLVNASIETYRSCGFTADGALFDITDEPAAADAIQRVERDLGPIDILINNAGIIKRVSMRDMPVEDFRRVLDVDLTGAFIVSRQVVEGMIKNGGGKIINICSMMSELGRDSVGAYAAAKGGLKMLTRSLATEWARFNVQVNGIGPGYFATEQTAPIRTEGHPFNEFILSRTPAGRWGEPSDLAGTAVFLSSKASDFVNGQIVYVDGGILATIGRPSSER